MTLGIAWVRELGGIRELVVASDSRLSGGKFWDANPKIMMLPRSDAVLTFAGDTADAYPLMLQIGNAIMAHPPAVSREMDLPEMKGHLLRVINECRRHVSNLPHGHFGPVINDAKFMLAGYSWRRKSFKIWTLHFDASIDRFTFRPCTPWRAQAGSQKWAAFIGDADLVKTAKIKLVDLLRNRGKLGRGSFDMEPLEVLRDLLRSGNHTEIGGAPQMAKIYEHANSRAFPIYWPDLASGRISHLGRPMLSYERPRGKIVDPDNL